MFKHLLVMIAIKYEKCVEYSGFKYVLNAIELKIALCDTLTLAIIAGLGFGRIVIN